MIMKKTRIPPTIPTNQQCSFTEVDLRTNDGERAHTVLGNLFMIPSLGELGSRYSCCTGISD